MIRVITKMHPELQGMAGQADGIWNPSPFFGVAGRHQSPTDFFNETLFVLRNKLSGFKW